jgi:glutathione S-transferase
MKNLQVSAFRWVPPFAQGLVRDLRVRWAIEEAGRDYEAKLIGFEDQATPDYRKMQPFGQVPAIDENGLVLFESGAIVMHIAEESSALMPADPEDRARVKTWMFAALNTVEPPIMMSNFIEMSPLKDEAGVRDLRGNLTQWIETRLDNVQAFLGERQYLIADRFTAADLLMTTVLRILRTTDLMEKRPQLAAYQARCESRPAFKKALDAQLGAFRHNAPPANAQAGASAS